MTDQSSASRVTPLRTLPFLALTLLGACVDTAPPGVEVNEMEAIAGIEPQSGIATDALAAVSYSGSEKFFVVFYLPAKIDAKQKAAAPGKLCASRGLKVGEVEDGQLEHPSEMPGTQKLVVRCT